MSLLEAEATPIEEVDEELEAESGLGYGGIMQEGDGEISYEATRDAGVHNSNFQFEELSMVIQRE